MTVVISIVIPSWYTNHLTTLYLPGPPSCQSDNTGAIVGGVVVILLALILAIAAIMIAYLVLKQRRTGGVNLK